MPAKITGLPGIPPYIVALLHHSCELSKLVLDYSTIKE